MFFVGATGQLLTLILTVCLPFVFILSGHQKISIEQTTLHFENQIIHSEISSVGNDTFHFTESLADDIQIQKTEFIPLFAQRFIPYEFREEWKSIYSTSSGNKAPPSFSCFYC